MEIKINVLPDVGVQQGGGGECWLTGRGNRFDCISFPQRSRWVGDFGGFDLEEGTGEVNPIPRNKKT